MDPKTQREEYPIVRAGGIERESICMHGRVGERERERERENERDKEHMHAWERERERAKALWLLFSYAFFFPLGLSYANWA